MTKPYVESLNNHLEQLWPRLVAESEEVQKKDPVLSSYVRSVILGRKDFADALGHLLSEELGSKYMNAVQVLDIIHQAYAAWPALIIAAQKDLLAILERDPAAPTVLVPFLFFKGFHALQSHRVAHWLFLSGRQTLSFYLQSQIAKRFAVDIHPGATIGQGVMMDHANGIVIGETAVVEDNVSFLHSVTLGGTGKEGGDRHPKIRKGVMIGAGAKILGNIEVGASSKVAAGSVVLENVPPCVVVAGVPARIVGKIDCDNPFAVMDQTVPIQK